MAPIARLLLVALCLLAARAHAAFVADPPGDTVHAGPDIVGVSADVVGANVVVTVSFAGSISPPYSGRADELLAAVVFDTDGNHSGNFDELVAFCPTLVPQIGIDYFVVLERQGTSGVVRDRNAVNTSTYAVISYGSNSFTLTVPLAAIGAGSAPILVGAGASDRDVDNMTAVASDCAPNSGPVTALAAASGPPVVASGTAQAGATRTFRAPVAGTRYDWDLDGDGIVDRIGASDALDVTYPGAFAGNVSVYATASNGARTVSTLAIVNTAPRLAASVTGAAVQVCGDGDASPEPGETWRLPVRIANQGNAATSGGSALFAAQDRLDAAAGGSAIDGKLVVETPLVDVGTLAPGASLDASVSVTLAQNAGCGTSYALAFGGGVDAVSSNPGASTALASFAIPPTCQVYGGTCAPVPKANVTPRQGLYYNPNRSGNGLSNFVIPVAGAAPVFFGAWFTGAADHTPTWYVIQGPLVGSVVVAPIYRFVRDVEAASFSVRSSVVGQAVVTMKSSERIALLWQIGTKSGIELMDYFVGGAAPAPNRTGAWYNTAESGWGQVIHSFVSGGTNYVFAVDYLYDGAGEPRWVLGQGTDAQLGAGSAHQTFMVHCPGCPWIADWNNLPLGSGSASETFIDATHGRTTTSFEFVPPLTGTWTRTDLPIELLTTPQ